MARLNERTREQKRAPRMRRTRCIEQMKVGQEHEVLRLRVMEEQETLKSARSGCVVVRLTLRPVQPTDMFLIRYGHPQPALNRPFPRVVGCEGFGIVHQGLVLQYVCVHAHKQCAQVPHRLIHAQRTCHVATELCRQLIQLAKHWGIKTINIVRRDAWKEKLRALGADEVINSETEDVVERVKEITRGKLAYTAVDAVAGSFTKIVAAAVRDNGKVLVYGLLSGDWDLTLSAADLMRGVQVSWWWMLPNYIPTPAKRSEVATQVMKLLEQHIITPSTCTKFPLEDFLAAIAESEIPDRDNKVLLVS